MKIAAIIPAYNEEKTIASVIQVIRAIPAISAVIVVDDGSSDKTAELAIHAGAQVITQIRAGKGAALSVAAHSTDADILFFSDADLVGLKREHVESVLQSVVAGDAAMCVGLRDRGILLNWLMTYVFPIIGGERAIRREIFLKISALGIKDFGIEIAMNAYCKKKNLPTCLIMMSGVKQVIKERKYGLVRGMIARIAMIIQVAKTELSIRFFFRNN